MARPGVRITFVNAGEPGDLELPPIGPLIGVVLGKERIVVEDAPLEPPEGSGLEIARWLAAQLELQRATGLEPDAPIHTNMRLSAPDGGIYLRFGGLSVHNEERPQPELGPFSGVFVGDNKIEADGKLLATRPSKGDSWDLTQDAGANAAVTRRSDIWVRSGSTRHHAVIAAVARPDAETERVPPAVPAEPPRTERVLRDADADLLARGDRIRAMRLLVAKEPALSKESAVSGSLLERVGTMDVPITTRAPSVRSGWRDWLWRLRLPVAGVLVLALALSGMLVLRGGPTGGGSVRQVSIGDRVSATGWEFTVSSVTRGGSAGSALPRGLFLMVRMGAVNRGSAGAQLSPREFELFDRAGKSYGAESNEGPAYTAGGGPFSWPASFPVGRSISVTVLFDVDSSASELQLGFRSAPDTRVKLD